MQDLKIDVLQAGIVATRTALREGVLSIDIWDRSTGLGLVEWNGNPMAVALFNQLTETLDETLTDSSLPGLDDYYYIDLEDNRAVVVIDHGDNLMQSWFLDSQKVNPGILLGMAIPKAIATVESARESGGSTGGVDPSMQLGLILQAGKMGLWDMIVDPQDPTGAKNAFTWTPEFRGMLGFSDEKDFPNVLESWSNRLHPDHKDITLEAFGKHLNDKTGETGYDVEYMLQKKDGTYRWYRATGETTRDADGTPLRVVGVLRDIHEDRTKSGATDWRDNTAS